MFKWQTMPHVYIVLKPQCDGLLFEEWDFITAHVENYNVVNEDDKDLTLLAKHKIVEVRGFLGSWRRDLLPLILGTKLSQFYEEERKILKQNSNLEKNAWLKTKLVGEGTCRPPQLYRKKNYGCSSHHRLCDTNKATWCVVTPTHNFQASFTKV